MVTQLQLEIDSTVHKILTEHAKQDGVSIEALIIRLLEKYIRDIDKPAESVRKVWKGDSCGAPSPDGRYFSFTNWSHGNLAVRDLVTGEDRDLTDEGAWDDTGHWAERSVWSPDSKQIAYGWASYVEPAELRVVGLDSSKPRVIYRHSDKQTGYHLSEWSQDGKYLLTMFRRQTDEKPMWDLALVSVADGSVQVLKSLDGFHRDWKRYNRSLSPDGRYVVYDRPMEEHEGACDIFILPTDGSGKEIPLVEHPADDSRPIWTPDGKGVIFISNRSGTSDAWFIQVADGKPVGGSQLVKREIGEIHPMGFTREGSLYYSSGGISADVYVATIDPESGEFLEPPTEAIGQFEGFNGGPAWSPDGKNLAYISLRPSPDSSSRKPVLVIRSEETGEERELHPRIQNFRWSPTQRSTFSWSPDGRSIIYRMGLQLINVQTGDVTSIVQLAPDNSAVGKVKIGGSEWSHDGKVIFYSKQTEDSPWSIVAHDLETGKEKELCREGVGWQGLAISPDGRQLAFIGDRAIKVMSIEGGEPRELFRLTGPGYSPDPSVEFYELIPPVAWTADGSYILFGKSGQSIAPELWRIPAEGGEPQKFLEIPRTMNDISFHPDGRRIALSIRRSGYSTGGIWAMENFLPGLATDK
jgi:Tol biopolymer transport system component